LDKTIRIWNTAGVLLREFNGHNGGVNSVSFSSDGKRIVSGGSDKAIRMWSLDIK
jgi:WD40 repeat protein